MVRGNLGAIPGTRTWQTKLGSLLKSPSLMEPTTAPGLGHSPLSIPRSSCDGYFLIGLFSPILFWSRAPGLAPGQQRYPFRK